MIPKQLKQMKFCRVKFKGKLPFEKDWTNKKYSYDEIQKHFPKENYGVLTGINQLGVLDDDTEDKILMRLFKSSFGKTFRVRDHYYIKLKDWDCKKIIFYDSEGKHLGELQGLGQQAVGPGSTHPSGEIYDLREDIQIKEISFEDFKNTFKEYIPTIKGVSENLKIKTSWEGDDIKEIPLSAVISFAGLNDVGKGCYQGSHPKHGSNGGMNFRINTLNNTWYCFRCNAGGSSPELIAVMEGIIDCSQAGRGCLSGSKGSEVIKVAREKYGLKSPEIQTEKKPVGWALSINIKKMAEKNNLLNCPFCSVPFEFNENLGFFKCNACGIRGGLKVFAGLCLKQKRRITP
jgi:hypothetical protein